MAEEQEFILYDAVSSKKSCPTSMLFFLTYIEFCGSRMQGEVLTLLSPVDD